MPVDPSIISSASQALNNTANYFATQNINRKTRKWNEEQYSKQRADSLADWYRQNEYNSPMSQMQRLREAGLNENLVYGKGADNTSDAVRSSNTPSWNPQSPKFSFDASQSLLLGYDLKMKQAQIDNLKVQNTVLDQERLLKAAQVLQTTTGVETSKFDLGMKQQLRDNSLEMAIGQLRKQSADIKYTLDSNDRANLHNSMSLKEGVQRIISSKVGNKLTSAQTAEVNARIKNLEIDSKLKEQDLELWKKGVTKHDSIYYRLAAKWVDQISDIIQKVAGVSDNAAKGIRRTWPFKIPFFK